MTQIAVSFAVCLVSALVPVINAELYLLGAGAVVDSAPLWALALAAGAGQTAGKVLYFYMGRGALNLPWLRRHERKPGRWAQRMGRLRAKAERRPAWAAGLVWVSAFVGLPPFMLVCVLAGAIRMRILTFIVLSMVGRTARFGVIVYAPGFAAGLVG